MDQAQVLLSASDIGFFSFETRDMKLETTLKVNVVNVVNVVNMWKSATFTRNAMKTKTR